MHPASVPARLVEAGVPVVTGDAHTITYRAGNHAVTADLIVAERVSSPTLALDRSRSRNGHRIFVVCDTISAQARSALLAEEGVDLSVGSTGELVLSGTVYRAPAVAQPRRGAGERSWRRRAAERICVLTSEHLRQSDVAAAIAVSQQAISKMVEKAPLPNTPMAEESRRECLVALTSVPADDGLIETYWYGTDSVTDQVSSAIRLGAELTVRVLAGGEVAADVLAPWRVPTHGLVYAEELIDLTVFDLVEATAEEATLTVRVPADQTVWATAGWWNQVSGTQRPGVVTADPVVVLQDISAGADIDDGAPQRLADWIASR